MTKNNGMNLVMISVLIFMSCLSTPVKAESIYNTAFLTDEQLTNSQAMNTDQIQSFLAGKGSYLSNTLQDSDGVSFLPAQAISDAAAQYGINPKVIITTLQKESSSISRNTPPSNLGFIAGCVATNTARQQIACIAERFRSYYDSITNNGQTVSGWKVGVGKATQDGVTVTPASRAVAGQFTYTPYAGGNWGGNNANIGGVYLFYKIWNDYGFAQALPAVTKRIGIEAGHSSSDPGASSCDSVYHEANITYDIAQRIQQKLTNAGYEVTLIRDNKGSIAGASFDAFIALHVDYCPGGAVTGYKTGRYGGAAGTGMLGNGDASDQLVQSIWDNYGAATGIPQDRSSGHYTNAFRYYFALSGSSNGVAAQTPSAILEMGWMRDPDLSKLINNPDSVATGIYNGLVNFLGGVIVDPCATPSPNADQAALYQHEYYCGAYVILNPGEYPNPAALGFANDQVSSVKVGSNVKLILCKDDGFSGGCEDFSGDDSRLFDNSIGNDQVSSAKVVWNKAYVPANQNIVNNGDFGTNSLSYWSAWGQVAYAFYNSGVLNFKLENNLGGGSIYQTWSYAVPASAPIEMTLQFGNSSNVTKTPTAIIRSQSTWDGAITCQFTVPPNASLQNYVVRGRVPTEWANFMIEFSPNPQDGIPDLLMDNVDVRYRPDLNPASVECVSPDSVQPSGTLTAPANGETIMGTGTYSITADAWDNAGGSGVKTVEFHINYDGQWHQIGTDNSSP